MSIVCMAKQSGSHLWRLFNTSHYNNTTRLNTQGTDKAESKDTESIGGSFGQGLKHTRYEALHIMAN